MAILRIRPALLLMGCSVVVFVGSPRVFADDTTDAGIEFFEGKIRPVLAVQCYKCHAANAESPQGGLLLDSRAGIRAGGESGHAVVPHDVEESLIVSALRHEDLEMPPTSRLPEAVIEDFIRWIEMGAPDPRNSSVATTANEIDLDAGKSFWAYQPLRDVSIPKVQNARWPTTELDHFVLAALEAAGLAPVADAPRATMIRRATYDLVGLPPTPAAIAAFQHDTDTGAFERVVDRLLESHHYGERWGRHWLDVARYAESMGRTRNYPLPYAWRYRNWVIDAVSEDKPYDAFVRAQIAGDLMEHARAADDEAATIATGFLALGSHDLNERDLAKFRMDVADEQINVVMRGILATTAGCARCHDHKFDPIPTTDYYALAGIFRSSKLLAGYQAKNKGKDIATDLLVKLSGDGTLVEQLGKQQARQQARLKQELAQLRRQMQQWKRLTSGKKAKRDGDRDGKNAGNAISPAEARRRLIQARKAIKQKTNRLKQLEQPPRGTNYAMAVCDEDKPRNCRVHVRGDTAKLGAEVPRGFLQVLQREYDPVEFTGSGRLELAAWLTNADSPAGALAARVMVNRVWHHLFGQGLVRTVDNFGASGERPANLELLEHLAGHFVNDGWSVKRLIRYIMLSRAYQLSSDFSAANYELDPENRLLWRMSPRRVEVEALRDALLFIAGNLQTKRPDASPMITIAAGEMNFGTVDKALRQNYRSVYLPVARGFVPTMFTVFDFAEPSEPKGRRDVTTVAPQALFMMNSEFVIKQSRDAAAKLLARKYANNEDRARAVYLETLGRLPSQAEAESVTAYLQQAQSPAANRNDTAVVPTSNHDIWSSLYQALFACAEFRYVY